jgi:RNA polymerase sigma-70 factor (TIGR02943 family)
MNIEGKDETSIDKAHLADPQKWVANHADYLFTYTITRVNDEEVARDLIQETFLAALERVEKFEGRSSERTWLTAILKNKIIDMYRKKSSGLLRRQELATTALEEEDFFEEDGHWKVHEQPQVFGIGLHDPLSAKEFNTVLQKCMRKLPVLWAAVFTMKHMDDEATETICSQLKVTPGNFWVIIHRTKVNLRTCLQKNWN